MANCTGRFSIIAAAIALLLIGPDAVSQSSMQFNREAYEESVRMTQDEQSRIVSLLGDADTKIKSLDEARRSETQLLKVERLSQEITILESQVERLRHQIMQANALQDELAAIGKSGKYRRLKKLLPRIEQVTGKSLVSATADAETKTRANRPEKTSEAKDSGKKEKKEKVAKAAKDKAERKADGKAAKDSSKLARKRPKKEKKDKVARGTKDKSERKTQSKSAKESKKLAGKPPKKEKKDIVGKDRSERKSDSRTEKLKEKKKLAKVTKNRSERKAEKKAKKQNGTTEVGELVILEGELAPSDEASLEASAPVNERPKARSGTYHLPSSAHLLTQGAANPCTFAYEGIDDFSGEPKKELVAETFFTYTHPQLKVHLKGKEYLVATGSLSSVAGGFRFLSLTFRISSTNAAKEYGYLAERSLLNLKLLSGETLSLYSQNRAAGRVDSKTNETVYKVRYPIDHQNVKTLLKSEVDKVRVVWSTGYEDYEVFNIDFLSRQLSCLTSK